MEKEKEKEKERERGGIWGLWGDESGLLFHLKASLMAVSKCTFGGLIRHHEFFCRLPCINTTHFICAILIYNAIYSGQERKERPPEPQIQRKHWH